MHFMIKPVMLQVLGFGEVFDSTLVLTQSDKYRLSTATKDGNFCDQLFI